MAEITCQICFDQIHGGEVQFVYPCQHYGHLLCAARWELSDSCLRDGTCPICKRVFPDIIPTMSDALDFHGLERPTPPSNDATITPYAVCPSDVIPVCCTRLHANFDDRMQWAPYIDRGVSGHGRVVLEWQCMVCHTVLTIDDRRLSFYREQQRREGRRELCTRHDTALVFYMRPCVAPVEVCSVQHDPFEVPCIVDHLSDCVFYRDGPIEICSSDSEPMQEDLHSSSGLPRGPDAAAGGHDASPGPAGLPAGEDNAGLPAGEDNADDTMCEEEGEAGESEPGENDSIVIDSSDCACSFLPHDSSSD